MSKKNIKKLSIVIILFSTFLAGLYTIRNDSRLRNKFSSPQSPLSTKEDKKNQGETATEDQVETCKNSLPEFGNISDNSKSILYTTRCEIKHGVTLQNERQVLRAYIRGIGNEYNKKLIETEDSILYASVLGKNEDVIRIETSDSFGGNEKSYFFNKKGEEITSNDEELKRNREFFSPDKKYVASQPPMGENEYRPAAVVIVTDISSGEKQEFDFQSEVQKLNGVYIDSWSPDSKHVYVAGGLYEFYAPAKLWRIDVEKNQVKKIDLENLSYPIHIYPEYGVAFADNDSGAEDMFGGDFVSSGRAADFKDVEKSIRTSKLYKIDLATGAVTLFAKETALDSFRSLFFNGKSVYYEATYGIEHIDEDTIRNASVVKKVDLKTEEVSKYSDDESHIELFIPEKNALIMQEDKKIYYVNLEGDKREYIAEATTLSQGIDQLDLEYIRNVIGIVD